MKTATADRDEFDDQGDCDCQYDDYCGICDPPPTPAERKRLYRAHQKRMRMMRKKSGLSRRKWQELLATHPDMLPMGVINGHLLLIEKNSLMPATQEVLAWRQDWMRPQEGE